ncbi:MAG: DUF4442 domain-containing protein [Chloroflexota bacterium]
MPESLRSRLYRFRFNIFPGFRGTGGRVTYLSSDYLEIHVKLPLNWRTRNLVGTIFGGSIYGSIDPFYMVMFMNALGSDYIVWDKSARIQFKRPGRSMLTAKFIIAPAELRELKAELNAKGKVERNYVVELIDQEGQVCAVVDKHLYFRKKNFNN